MNFFDFASTGKSTPFSFERIRCHLPTNKPAIPDQSDQIKTNDLMKSLDLIMSTSENIAQVSSALDRQYSEINGINNQFISINEKMEALFGEITTEIQTQND